MAFGAPEVCCQCAIESFLVHCLDDRTAQAMSAAVMTNCDGLIVSEGWRATAAPKGISEGLQSS